MAIAGVAPVVDAIPPAFAPAATLGSLFRSRRHSICSRSRLARPAVAVPRAVVSPGPGAADTPPPSEAAPLPSPIAVPSSVEAASSSVPRTPAVGAPMPAGRRPAWFRVPAPRVAVDTTFSDVSDSVHSRSLHTVCEEAACPNIGECWAGGTATLMLLGDTCTRGCRFCAVATSPTPPPPDENEPYATAVAVSQWGLDYVVLTAVDRDDLPDGGAEHFAATVRAIKLATPHVVVEVLVGDYGGASAAAKAVDILVDAGVDVFAHNVETVRRLQPHVRDRRAGYDSSMGVLAAAARVGHPVGVYTKTSLMLGLGETDAEIREAMVDLRAAGVDVLTLGQYLRPTEHHLSVVEYVHPDAFAKWEAEGLAMGFRYVTAGPLVRSSYKAGDFFRAAGMQPRGGWASQKEGKRG
ncbi:hypothetical protein MMPV_005538 [Pyropia vietnamensis]